MADSKDLLNLVKIRDDFVDSCKKTGCFDEVLTKQPPAGFHGKIASVQFGDGAIAPGVSGLDISGVDQAIFLMIWSPAKLQPLDDIDVETLETLSKFLNQLHEDLNFGGDVMVIEVMQIRWFTKNIFLEDNQIYRFIDVRIPFTVADVWTQQKS
jgi:hypothetical protein